MKIKFPPERGKVQFFPTREEVDELFMNKTLKEQLAIHKKYPELYKYASKSILHREFFFVIL